MSSAQLAPTKIASTVMDDVATDDGLLGDVAMGDAAPGDTAILMDVAVPTCSRQAVSKTSPSGRVPTSCSEFPASSGECSPGELLSKAQPEPCTHIARASLILRRNRAEVEQLHAWPEISLRGLADEGVLGWNIPVEYNGSGLAQRDLLAAYIELASQCLTTTFILSQRNSACQKLIESSQAEVKERLLPPIAAGELLVTLGVSHLTTSRQHQGRPAVLATPTDKGWVLDGTIPWVTAAPRADLIVAGGTCADGKQILVLLPTDARGVHVHAPQSMMGLNGSLTTSITLDAVEVPARYLLAGPVEGVMKRGGGTGSWATSALAIGLAKHACRELAVEAQARPDLAELVAPLAEECELLERSLLISAVPPAFPLDAARLRTQANSLVTRATQAWLAACKGAAYMADHPAAMAVQQAMFFFVWSCPQPVLAAALRELAVARS